MATPSTFWLAEFAYIVTDIRDIVLSIPFREFAISSHEFIIVQVFIYLYQYLTLSLLAECTFLMLE